MVIRLKKKKNSPLLLLLLLHPVKAQPFFAQFQINFQKLFESFLKRF